MTTVSAQDLTKCSICGSCVTNIVETDKGSVAFCAEHFQLCWNTIPQLLAKLVYDVLFKDEQ